MPACMPACMMRWRTVSTVTTCQQQHYVSTSRLAKHTHYNGPLLVSPVVCDCCLTSAGLDIASLVAQQALHVYVCAREWSKPKQLAGPAVKACSNTQKRGMITRLTASGESAQHSCRPCTSCHGAQQIVVCLHSSTTNCA